MQLNDQELACVLAGLRLLQDKINYEGMCFVASMEHFDHVALLETDELDLLCERINIDSNLA